MSAPTSAQLSISRNAPLRRNSLVQLTRRKNARSFNNLFALRLQIEESREICMNVPCEEESGPLEPFLRQRRNSSGNYLASNNGHLHLTDPRIHLQIRHIQRLHIRPQTILLHQLATLRIPPTLLIHQPSVTMLFKTPTAN